MPSTNGLLAILEAVVIGGSYIAVSCSLITMNKYLMNDDRFPFAKALTSIHMSFTFIMTAILYKVVPSMYPTMNTAKENWQRLLTFLVPLGALFALALYCSNRAYLYSSVAFLQFCKEGNVVIIFAMAVALGLQAFSWTKVGILSVVTLGCTLCAHGEVHFAWMGFVLQIVSQFAECAKNTIGELVLKGSGMKLDVLTFVLFQSPCTALPLIVSTAMTWQPEIYTAFQANWQAILLNALNAWVLNLLIATTLKRLSAVGFVIIGIMKDTAVVIITSIVFGDSVASMQMVGFTITLAGIAMWANMKIQEQAEQEKLGEQEPIVKPVRV